MAREIQDNNRTRLVLTGPAKQPTEMWVEYIVEDGDLVESGQALRFKGTDFNAKIGKLWEGSVEQIKAAEKL